MSASPTVYSIPNNAQQRSGSLFEPLPQYRAWRFDNRTILDLREEIAYLHGYIETLRNLRLELRESVPDVHYIEYRLRELLDTVEQRKRLLRQHERNPLALAWPTGTGKLGQLALDLKAVWPLPQFCREMLLLDLQGRGDRLRAICPIPTHRETTPSFVVFVREDRFKCFGCGAHGDVYDLIRLIYGHEDFRSQVRMLADTVGRSMDTSR